MGIMSKKDTKKQTKKRGRGRPATFDPAICEQVVKLCKLGLTDKELSDVFSVSERTWNYWKGNYPELLHAIRAGKEVADAIIAERLFERAKGFEHDAIELKVVSDGMGMGSSVEKVAVRKIYPPDTIAAMFWLKNRQPDRWRERAEVDHTSKGESIAQPMSNQQFAKLVKMLNGTDSGKGKRVEKTA